MSLKAKKPKIRRINTRKVSFVKYDGLPCPDFEGKIDFKGWVNVWSWRNFALNSLLNLLKPFGGSRFKVADRVRVYLCFACGKVTEVPVGGERLTQCPNCGATVGQPIRLTVVIEEFCEHCGRPVFYDTWTLTGTCACRRYDLLGVIVKRIQSAVRTDDAEFVRTLYRVLLEFHKGGDENGEGSSAGE